LQTKNAADSAMETGQVDQHRLMVTYLDQLIKPVKKQLKFFFLNQKQF